jgi:flavin reductase (NADH)/flavin reductase
MPADTRLDDGGSEPEKGEEANARSSGREEVREVIELRRELEAFVARVGARHVTPAQLDELHALVEAFLRGTEEVVARPKDDDERLRMIADRFRAAFRRHSTTVTVLTYHDKEGRACGMTATSVASLSASPPSLIACVNRTARSRDDIIAAGKFGVNVLGLSQQAIAAHCSRPGSDKVLQSEWLVEDADAATPLLRDALAHLDCRVARVHDEYTHSIVVADVLRVWLGAAEMPLTYFQGAYGTPDPKTEPYEALWERITTAFL